jgi:hypothetical protein
MGRIGPGYGFYEAGGTPIVNFFARLSNTGSQIRGIKIEVLFLNY